MKSINIGITFITDDGRKIQQTGIYPSPACPSIRKLVELILFSIADETGLSFKIKADIKRIEKELGYE